MHALAARLAVAPRDDGRSVAWLAYVPIPGVALAAVLIRPDERLVRYHAWQGTLAVLGILAFLTGIGLLAGISEAGAYRTVMGLVAGLGLLAGLVQLGWGMASAILGKYARVRPWWDVAAAIKG